MSGYHYPPGNHSPPESSIDIIRRLAYYYLTLETASRFFARPTITSSDLLFAEPPPKDHHPLVKERITSWLLGDDDGRLWDLTRSFRTIEWDLALARYHDAIRKLNVVGERYPLLLSSSPSLHYLWARLRAQQGYPALAAWHRRKAYDCFAGYTNHFLSVSGDSLALKALLKIVLLRGDERGDEVTVEFAMCLMEAYEVYVKNRHARNIGYFHCDIFRIYLEYQHVIFRAEGVNVDILDFQKKLVLKVIEHHIQSGHFFASYTLFKYLLKEITLSYALPDTVNRFGDIFDKNPPTMSLWMKILAELYLSSSKNILNEINREGPITSDSVDLVWTLLCKSHEYASQAGDKILIKETRWLKYIFQENIKIEADRMKYEDSPAHEVWPFRYDYEHILSFFKEAYFSYFAEMDDAERISRGLVQFGGVLGLTGVKGAERLLMPVWAHYQHVTGGWRGHNPYWAAVDVAERRMDLSGALCACRKYEKRTNLNYEERKRVLKAKMKVCRNLELLEEGARAGRELIDLSKEEGTREDISEARYDLLFLKADLMHTIDEKTRPAFAKNLITDFIVYIKRDIGSRPTGIETAKKSVLFGAFMLEACEMKGVGKGYLEAFKTLEQFTSLMTNKTFKLNATEDWMEYMALYRCIAYFMTGKRGVAIRMAKKKALDPAFELRLRELYPLAEQETKRKLQAEWEILFIMLYVQGWQEVLVDSREDRKIAKDIRVCDHRQFWTVVDRLLKYADTQAIRELHAKVGYHAGYFCELRSEWDKALGFYTLAMDALQDLEVYGCKSLKPDYFLPTFMRDTDFETVTSRALSCLVSLRELREFKKLRNLFEEENNAQLANQEPQSFRAAAMENIELMKKKRYERDECFELWTWAQAQKGSEFRRILGRKTIWENHQSVLHEIEKMKVFERPPLIGIVTVWINSLMKALGSSGGHGYWSLRWSNIADSQFCQFAQLKIAVNELDRDPRLRSALTFFTGTPPTRDDFSTIREYRSDDQSIVFIDYAVVDGEVFLLWNVETDKRGPDAAISGCRSGSMALRLSESDVRDWSDELLQSGLHGRKISTLINEGRALVQPLLKVLRLGDLVVIGTSYLTSRIPFHALPLGEWENGKLYTLGQYVNIVYTPNFLITKLGMSRLAGYLGRPKIPAGNYRASLCTAQGPGVGSRTQKYHRMVMENIRKLFRRDRLHIVGGIGATKLDVREQIMRTTDFVQFIGDIRLNPRDKKPENGIVTISPGVYLTAREIASDFHFRNGNCPIVLILSQQPDTLPSRATLTNIPDGLVSAFFQAGASSVVSTLWPVPGYVAARFTELFYTDFFGACKENRDKVWDVARAVRLATLSLREELEYHSPHWAAFVLNGAWVRGLKVGGRISTMRGKPISTDFEEYRQPSGFGEPEDGYY
ncbi:hypothetical protein H072_4220 [Dactylellina haptotyla CBS 200.50]|uniref:CHAT domain-containing protein n=1 Tax=Dactylellina haptotyla (strain CBS 200.50) TaxID=1284197 RepID=S8AFP8_DACHA|nr:hypothetical protein H072_4220 [Dactylellina haptotyla CBS 200.50]